MSQLKYPVLIQEYVAIHLAVIFMTNRDKIKYVGNPHNNSPEQSMDDCYMKSGFFFSAYDAAVSCPLLKLKAFTDTP